MIKMSHKPGHFLCHTEVKPAFRRQKTDDDQQVFWGKSYLAHYRSGLALAIYLYLIEKHI
jgi:hypothetical protein